LNKAYGEGYEHSPGDEGGVRSWFKGGTEVQLMTLSGMGYALDYRDLLQAHAATLTPGLPGHRADGADRAAAKIMRPYHTVHHRLLAFGHK
jgi:hypothetical protein